MLGRWNERKSFSKRVQRWPETKGKIKMSHSTVDCKKSTFHKTASRISGTSLVTWSDKRSVTFFNVRGPVESSERLVACGLAERRHGLQ